MPKPSMLTLCQCG